jgi:hypothetical protein
MSYCYLNFTEVPDNIKIDQTWLRLKLKFIISCSHFYNDLILKFGYTTPCIAGMRDVSLAALLYFFGLSPVSYIDLTIFNMFCTAFLSLL